MKIALCMSGHIRTFDKTYQSWYDNLISQYNTDLYLHLWDSVGPKDMSQHNLDFKSGVDQSNMFNVENFVKTYGTSVNYSLFVESYDVHYQKFSDRAVSWYEQRDKQGLRTIDRPLANFSMYYKWYKCNELIEYKDYDLVIRTRPDIALNSRLPIECFVDSSQMYIPVAGSWGGDEISDYMTIGTQEQITKFCDLYNNLDEMYECAVANGDFTKVLYPHRMFHFWMERQNLNYKACDINCEIVR